jgi:phosphatidylglycerophosphate synthase
MTPENPPRVRLIGTNSTRIWGLTPAERVRRIAAKEGLEMAKAGEGGPLLLVASDYAFDPLWLDFMKARPNSVLTIQGKPALAHVVDGGGAALAAMEAGQVPVGLEPVQAEDHRDFYNKALRKLEWPFLVRLTPEAVPGIERRSYYGAYKGVTDVLTKYLWPEWALYLTRLCARAGITPNMVTAVGAIFNLLAMYAFWNGSYWAGMAFGLAFMVLDTVDGKLARCTVTSSKWGNVLDHGIDLVHPPFWWWAWGVGLSEVGLGLPRDQFETVMAVIVVGYVLQRATEGIFLRRFGMDMHTWGRIDSQFRLITARRNPNMVILFVSLLFGRPDIGLIGVAWWTGLSCIFHAVRLIQAEAARQRGKPVVSWMG